VNQEVKENNWREGVRMKERGQQGRERDKREKENQHRKRERQKGGDEVSKYF